MRLSKYYLGILASCLLLSGCANQIRSSLGIDTKAPDEFTVTAHAPLVMPESFASLPPKSGSRLANSSAPSLLSRYENEISGHHLSKNKQFNKDEVFLSELPYNNFSRQTLGEVREIIYEENTPDNSDKNYFKKQIAKLTSSSQAEYTVNAAEEARRLEEIGSNNKPINTDVAIVKKHNSIIGKMFGN